MKPLTPYILLLVGVVLSSMQTQAHNADLSLNFSSSPGSTIQFNGDQNSFQFNGSTFTGFGGLYLGTQWFVSNESGGTGSAVGLFGQVANGPFSYGPITINGNEESASVTGPLGALQISDGLGNNLTGKVNWEELQTFNYVGALNASLVLNIMDLSYSGTNPDLKSLVVTGVGDMNLTFQFSPGETLTSLSSGSSPFITSYSGSITAVPEPSSIGLLFLGVGALTLTRVLRKSNAKFEN